MILGLIKRTISVRDKDILLQLFKYYSIYIYKYIYFSHEVVTTPTNNLIRAIHTARYKHTLFTHLPR